MKNLFKTLITVITVVCMLASMTAFAANQTTVTKYNSNTSVNVVTTVSGVAKDAIVTYLVAKDTNTNGVADAGEIKYINQATSDGSDIEFSYAITGEGWSAGNAIADVKFGSNNADVAAALKDDVVIYDDIEFVVKDKYGNVLINDGAELVEEYYIGKGQSINATIEELPGYVIKSITIGGVAVDATVKAHNVAYGQKVEVVVEPITDTTVYLFEEATATDGLKVYDKKSGDELHVLTGIGYYVGVEDGKVDSAAIVFDGIDIDGAHPNYTYEATVGGGVSGYFAVQLAQKEAFAEGAKATCAHVTVGGKLVESK